MKNLVHSCFKVYQGIILIRKYYHILSLTNDKLEEILNVTYNSSVKGLNEKLCHGKTKKFIFLQWALKMNLILKLDDRTLVAEAGHISS